MDADVRVSVIVPVKNSAQFLEETLADLLNQSLKEIEILVVYDASQDGTLNILSDAQGKDKRVKIVQGGNSGPGGARNIGMKLAKGTHLIFIDSDDRMNYQMLETMYNEAVQTHAEICVCRSIEFKSNKKFRIIWDSIDLEKLPAGVNSYRSCSNFFFQSFTGWAWDKLFQKSFCDEYGIRFGDNYVLEDGRFVLPAMAYARRIAVIDQALIFHRRWNESLESGRDNINNHWQDVIGNILDIQQELKKNSEFFVLKKSFQNWAVNYLLWIFRKVTKENQKQLCSVLHENLLADLEIQKLARADFYHLGDYNLCQFLSNYQAEALPRMLWKHRITLGIYKLRRYGIKKAIKHLMWIDAR